MTKRDFIKEHREELDGYIQSVAKGSPKTDHERELWVDNDEGLYLWFKDEQRNNK